mgnify:FL=1|jgi:hypothetical protein|tara:strand:+ start:2654 stop:2899 length:246 start_codon:yes stop_codon:yes gene_type:complete
MTVYFDPRQPKKDPSEMTEEEKNYELGKQIVTAIANLFVSPLVLMLVWNACVPTIFGLSVIGYWSAMGLYIISRILLKKND